MRARTHTHTPWPRAAAHPDPAIRRTCGSSLPALRHPSSRHPLALQRSPRARRRQPSGPVWTAVFLSRQLSSRGAHFIRRHPTQPRPSCDVQAVNIKATTKRNKEYRHINPPATRQGFPHVHYIFQPDRGLQQCTQLKHITQVSSPDVPPLLKQKKRKENGYAQESIS